MAVLSTLGGLEQELNVSTEVAARVMLFVREAKSWLINLKGEAWYELVAEMEPVPRPIEWDAEYGLEEDPSYEEARSIAERAEALVALSYALPSLNLVLGADGGVVVTEWETAESGARTQTSFAHVDRLSEVASSLRRNAKILLGGDVVTNLDLGIGDSLDEIDLGTESTFLSAF